MPFDFKKEYREFYLPKAKPEIVTVPCANYIAVRGRGDPNEENGAYQRAIGVLYAVAYTLKMSKRAGHEIDSFFDYVVPPLEGFWQMPDTETVDYGRKSDFRWISVLRLPDFVTKADFDWAVEAAAKKKKLDCSKAECLAVDEGLCVQILHLGSFDDELESVAKGHEIDSFFDYVVPPLEGFWQMPDTETVDYGRKSDFRWISVLRLPDFVTKADFDWAVEAAAKKKKLDCSKAECLAVDEGLCVQILHLGSFDDELESVAKMDAFLRENGYENDLNDVRLHHEIYLSDPRRVAAEKRKTVLRHPIKKA